MISYGENDRYSRLCIGGSMLAAKQVKVLAASGTSPDRRWHSVDTTCPLG
jgi:hypothetical protein